jgi:hypothetical protein
MSIETYEFKDGDIEGATIESGDHIYLHDRDYDISILWIYKDDVIAMAKHFKLTAEDLV